ncbi:hypothetical protein [Prosthecobacter sp.]|uniref:hypothetical protein n=1 Tax=Prosthecobacter sp. TaxID=1965333 RepID=UPI0037844B53
MKAARILFIAAAVSAMLKAQEATVVKAVGDRAQRGKLSDQRQFVRGDTGKWSDAATLQHIPPLAQKPQGLTLDEWSEQLAEKETATTATDDNWLIFRSRQYDDNDRMWIEKIERRGNEFTVTMHEAIWHGKYFKTFTYYEVTAVNFGRLPPGNYAVKWLVKPLTFKQLEKPAQPNKDNKDNWPMDEQPAGGKPVELHAVFSVR